MTLRALDVKTSAEYCVGEPSPSVMSEMNQKHINCLILFRILYSANSNFIQITN